MAYSSYDSQLQDDEEDQVGGQPAVKPGSTQTSSAPGGAGSGPSSAPVAPISQGSSNNQRTFAGIQDYIKSNKNQTGNLANQVGSAVRTAGNEARTAIQSGSNRFNQEVDRNTVKTDNRVIDRVSNDPTALVGNVKNTGNLNQNPYNNPISNNRVTTTNNPVNNFSIEGSLPNSQYSGGLINNRVNTNTPSRNSGNFNISGNTPKVENTGLGKAQENMKNLGDLKSLVNMRDAEYKGPNSLLETDYYQPILNEVEEAERASAQARTEEGNRDLLSDLHKQQIGYVNSGALGLDNALLRSDQNARDILTSAADSNSDLNRILTGAVGGAATKASAGKSTTDRTRALARGEIAGARNDFNQDLNNRVNDAISNASSVQEAIKNVLSTGGTPTSDQLAAMGVTPEQWEQISENAQYMNLSDYLTIGDPNINAGTFATDEDYARDAALELLMGETDNTLTDPSMAGTYDDGVSFDIPQTMSKIDQIMADRAEWNKQEEQRLQSIYNNIGNAARQGGPPPEVDPAILQKRPYPGPGKW